MTSDIVTAYRNFLQKWNPQVETENELLVNLGKAYSTANFIFGLDGHPEIKLHDTDGEIAQKITELKKSAGRCRVMTYVPLRRKRRNIGNAR